MSIILPGNLGTSIPQGNLRIDWTHPLTNGLINCYVPGVTFGNDLVGRTQLTLNGANVLSVGLCQEGPILYGNRSGVATGGILYSANLPSGDPLLMGNGAQTQYFRGSVSTTSGLMNSGYRPLFGVTYINPYASPYYVMGCTQYNTSASQLYGAWNSAGAKNTGSSVGSIPNSTSPGAMFSAALTGQVGGNLIVYISGAQNYSITFGASNPGTSASSQLELLGACNTSGLVGAGCTIFAVWSRVLSATEIAYLDANPYCFLIPVEGELPAVYSGAITGTLSVTEANDSLSGSASVLVSGTLTVTEGADTLSAGASVLVSGTLAITEGADSLSASGTVYLPVTGTLTVTEISDALSATGGVFNASITGVLTVTEGVDTLATAAWLINPPRLQVISNPGAEWQIYDRVAERSRHS